MKRYRAFIREAKMTHADALKVLGLTNLPSTDELKRLHRELVMKYHPDRNPGNAESLRKMQDINAAVDVLQGSTSAWSTSTKASSYEDWKSRQEKYKILAELAMRNCKVSIFEFTRHFETIFGEPFTLGKNEYHYTASSGTYASMSYEWHNEQRTIVLSMSVSVDFSDLLKGTKLSENDMYGLKMIIYTSILKDRRKVKLSQQNWAWTHKNDVLRDPELTFPSKKLRAQSSKAASREFKKRDALLVFEKELKARVSGGSDIGAFVPINDTFKLYFYRMTMLGKATWGLNGIYEKTQRVSQGGAHVMFYETENAFRLLTTAIKSLQNPNTTVADIEAAMVKFLADYKAQRDQ